VLLPACAAQCAESSHARSGRERDACDALTVQGKLKSMQINMNAVGRSVDEALRLLDAFQYVAEHGVVCPANWHPGDDTMEADPDGSQKYFASARARRCPGFLRMLLTAS
jgi:alkyl hydroperoxide reductase subunit AhpC